MNVSEYYAYLSAAREQLWNFLRALPQADLDRDLIEPGDRFHSIKDLVLHVTDVEDHWVHSVARGDGVNREGRYAHDWVKPDAAQYDLGWIIEYGREVNERTRAFLDSGPDMNRSVKLVQDDPASDTVTLDQLMWHVMTHEVRHTAQITLMIRQLGHTPPWLDYMRFARPQVTPAQSGGVDGLGLDDGEDEL
ncbi:putative damage-inducible protein DinB [Deinococcus metalli]|uniref:Damage-inducible protein DinB n=1 Tax=Deinococcus metalli TaxID=1141878 RepID=A0A7W8KDW4_9DEIO|nr:DinB family protein [Deinococcus metalli]MBB5376367.1 putative damage-inducible protein DinB [Deinococcus metalli]GHF38817.1 damage-inducible protein DinB [Deinococcus metalli]